MDDFIRQMLTISVAQICDNIGWHAITDSSMKIMTDILYHYINDLSVTSKKYAEHALGDVPDIGDVEKAFRQKSISLINLRGYIKNTGPVQFAHNLPMLNIPGNTLLNTIKPGTREIVTRSIHIHEHLPSMYAEPTKEEKTTDTEHIKNIVVETKHEPEEIIVHKRLREISSVVMTSGGFLSPSREGRLAESKLLPFPEVKVDKPRESSKLPIVSPSIKEEPSPKGSKKKIKSKKFKSVIKKKQKSSKYRLIVKIKDQKPKIQNTLQKLKEEKLLLPLESEIKQKVEPVIDVVSPPKIVETPKKIIPTPHINKTKIEEVLPKFSFFGPLPHGPILIPSTIPQIMNTIDKIEKPASPVLVKVENENNDIFRKEQKKKKKDKKKEKKERKKQKSKVKDKEKEKDKEKDKVKEKEKDKIKEKEKDKTKEKEKDKTKEKEKEKRKEKEKVKEKEKKKEKLKCIDKVPKIKLKLGTRIETITEILPIEKPPEEIVTIKQELQPMEVVDEQSKSEMSIDVLCDNNSPPKVPIQKIKTKIASKPIQSSLPPENETAIPPFYFDESGNQVWICPTCTKPDDGSPMIGCDGCDVWYHWVCVGIQCPPDCAVWYCPKCLIKRNQQPKGKRGRPRKNK